MNKPLFLGLNALFLLTFPAICSAQTSTESKTKHKFSIAADIKLKLGTQNVQVQDFTSIWYQNTQKKSEVEVLVRQFGVRSLVNGSEKVNMSMSGKVIKSTQSGSTTETPLAKAPPAQQALMTDTFDKTLTKISVDEEGKELKRNIVAGKGAIGIIKNGGIINNVRFFHPRFSKTKSWTSKRVYSLGNGQSISGDLKYEKQAEKDAAGNTVVKVSGVMTKESAQSGVTMKNLKYVFAGSQSYDEARKVWTTGKISVKLTCDLVSQNGNGKATGSIVLTLNEDKTK
ncbi:MAG: hypothetical protein P1V97_38575 [Planctomycetota bacterium]|nr:hypothetical protein [Planctomycetota bacterium]